MDAFRLARDTTRAKTRRRTITTREAALRIPLLALLLLYGTACPAETPKVYTHSLGQEAELRDGELRGREHAGKRAFYLELVRALLDELDLPLRIEEVPLARGLMLLQKGPNLVLFNLAQTPERLPLAHWIGPTLEETDWLYESSQAPTGIGRLEDARDLPVCVLNGSTHDARLSAAGFTRLTRQNGYAQCLGMLAAGRVALAASADLGLAQKLENAGVAPELIRRSAVMLGQDRGYIALSRDIPRQQAERWQQALEQLRRDGRFEALYQRYAQ